jgi:hypothetical protein
VDVQLQEAVWRRAEGRCEYCKFPVRYTRVPFQIDHIISEKHHGETVLDNLALACFFCNSYKGPNVGGIDPKSRELTRLFHPRHDNWHEHFSWRGAVLEGLSAVGRTTIDVFRINHPDAVAVREALLAEEVW